MKEALKIKTAKKQKGICELSAEQLPDKPRLFDTDRRQPKAEGGTYTDQNTRVVIPIAHMERHGNLRTREDIFDDLKTKMDDRRQIMSHRNGINNRLLANDRRTDKLSPDTIEFLAAELGTVDAKLTEKDKSIKAAIKELGKQDSFVAAVMKVKSVGELTVAACLVYIDLAKARHASSLWKYAGLHAASHERYQKGETSGGNKTLRTALYLMADSQMKGNGPYRSIYDQVKTRLAASEKIVKSRNTQGHLVEVAWKDAKPCHRHGAALRAVMKHFLADYWFVGRTFLGLETSPGYAEAVLGGGHRTIMPGERGWPVDGEGRINQTKETIGPK